MLFYTTSGERFEKGEKEEVISGYSTSFFTKFSIG